MRSRSLRSTAALFAVAVLLSACAADASTGAAADGSGAAAGACLEGSSDCQDTGGSIGAPPPGGSSDDPGSNIDEAQLLADAGGLLGTKEADLSADVRIGRRGEEAFALTEDYRIGRMTAELDPDDAGDFAVTSVVVELTEGPQTITAEG